MSWNEISSSPVLLACIPKGIYKPGGTSNPALSVKQTLRSPYRDFEPTPLGETWAYQYHQEKGGLEFWTNQSLVQSMRRRWPVGVLRQVESRPTPRYKIWGLAWVAEWRFDYFVLQGLTAIESAAYETGHLIPLPNGDGLETETVFDPRTPEDQRTIRLAPLVVREGQAVFRKELLKAYGGACGLSAYDAATALQAAHISGYAGLPSNTTANGLLLRADLHLLFDAGLLAFDGDNYRAHLSPCLAQSRYGEFHASPLRLPSDRSAWPSAVALEMHRQAVGL
ncbi:MAG: HNH endonuclease [Coriobacteriia bacterium]|nr:HNH endonuclease [Coriobacteriia bacterium]